jgi:glucose/mannose-6-phosphate isomerase
MMDLDDVKNFEILDQGRMIDEIDGLPAQMDVAWDLGGRFPLGEISGVRQVVLAGMGGSAIGADLVSSYVAPMATVPIIVWRDYDLPGFVADSSTLVIVSSHSGNTEETLSAFDRASEAGAQLVAITTGGELAKRADDSRSPLWRFDHLGQPRAAVGFSFTLILTLLTRLGLIPDPELEFEDALASMRSQKVSLKASSPVSSNPAKRMAGQFIGRWPLILGAGFLAPVARRWRTQIAELAKSVAQFEFLPEADHNMVAGVVNPEALFANTMAIFLDGDQLHERNRARLEATRQILMVEGFNTDVVRASGASRLAQQWTSLHYGDYAAYYLAMGYGVDPTPVEAIEDLKRRLSV